MILYVYYWMSTFKDRFKQIKTNKWRPIWCPADLPPTARPPRSRPRCRAPAGSGTSHRPAAAGGSAAARRPSREPGAVRPACPGGRRVCSPARWTPGWRSPGRPAPAPVWTTWLGTGWVWPSGGMAAWRSGPGGLWPRRTLEARAGTSDSGLLQLRQGIFFFLMTCSQCLYFVYSSCSEKMLTGGHETSSLSSASCTCHSSNPDCSSVSSFSEDAERPIHILTKHVSD